MMSVFSVGDEVVVDKNGSGWEYWIYSMDKTVGKVGTVIGYEDVDGDQFASVLFQLNGERRNFFYRDDFLRLNSSCEEEICPEMSIASLISGSSGQQPDGIDR